MLWTLWSRHGQPVPYTGAWCCAWCFYFYLKGRNKNILKKKKKAKQSRGEKPWGPWHIHFPLMPTIRWFSHHTPEVGEKVSQCVCSPGFCAKYSLPLIVNGRRQPPAPEQLSEFPKAGLGCFSALMKWMLPCQLEVVGADFVSRHPEM